VSREGRESFRDPQILTPEGREAERRRRARDPSVQEACPDAEQRELSVHRGLNDLQIQTARRLGRIAEAGILVEDLRCPWCGSTVKWSCLDGGGSADCELGTMVSRRPGGLGRPLCFWPGADLQRDLRGQVVVVWDRVLGDGARMHPRPLPWPPAER